MKIRSKFDFLKKLRLCAGDCSLKKKGHIKKRLIIPLLVIIFHVILTVPFSSLCLGESILYDEDFNDKQAQGWELKGKWHAEEGVFSGEENSWAIYEEASWDYFGTSLRVRILVSGSTLHINYRHCDLGRYFIGFQSNRLYIEKESPWGEFWGQISVATLHVDDVWYEITIIEESGAVKVYQDGDLILIFEDSEPLQSGSISLETLNTPMIDDVMSNRVVQVDDIKVFDLAPSAGPDLCLEFVSYDLGEDQLIITAEVKNIGDTYSPATVILAEAQDWSTTNTIKGLAVGETITVYLFLDISDDKRDGVYSFDINIDPNNIIQEIKEDNNNGGIYVEIPSNLPSYLYPAIGVGATSIAAIYWFLRNTSILSRAPPPTGYSCSGYEETMAEEEMYEETDADVKIIPPAERIINTGFSPITNAEKRINPFYPLAPRQLYYFWFEVGPKDLSSIEREDVILEVEKLPPEAVLKVVLFAYENEIEIFKEADIGEIKVKPNGKVIVTKKVESPDNLAQDSDLLDRRLFFLIRTPNKEGLSLLRCNLYYEQILIQSRLIEVSIKRDQVLSETPALQSKVEYSMSKTLSPNYLTQMTPQKFSMMMNRSNETHCIRLFGENDYKEDYCFDAEQLVSMIKLIRGALRKTTWDDENPWNDEKNYRYENVVAYDQFEEDIIRLARRSARFWSKFISPLGRQPEVDRFKDMLRYSTVFECVIKDKTDVAALFPLGLIYDYYLDTNRDLNAYSICPDFLDALNALGPLEEADCFKGNCPNSEYKDGNTIVCPSGFWGFRHSIGSPLGSKDDINHEMLYENTPEITVSVYPDFPTWEAHQQNLKQLMPDVIWNYSDKREETFVKLKSTNSHLFYFYCHGGLRKDLIPYILIGSDDENDITPSDFSGRRIYWTNPKPLVFINGCKTIASDPEIAIDFVEKIVGYSNASGVIGTEITVFENLASKFAEEFMHRFIHQRLSVGESVRQSRLALLKKRNPLGLVYNVYASPCLRLKPKII